jgi:hypothetical protein
MDSKTDNHPPAYDGPAKDPAHAEEGLDKNHGVLASSAAASLKGLDVLALNDLDPAMDMKMHLVNNAIDEIGWTNYHLKLFFLNGFGYVDHSTCAPPASCTDST